MAILEVKQLMKDFGETDVLKGISFSIKKGEVVAIIGSSGSGKSTLLRCLNFLENPDSGEIVVNGETIYETGDDLSDEIALREKRLHFGLVFQQFNLFPQLTVLKNVTLALDVAAKENLSKKKITKAEYGKILTDNIEIAKKLIQKVGLSEKLASYPCELSGGLQQRVAIARALALKPEILCFDEPTSALDPELTGEVLRVIQSLKTIENTMIVVTHEMDFAKNVADKIIFMSGGVIEEIGTPQQIFENPTSEKTKLFLKQYLNRIDTSTI
ncbi:MAG: amino acid ABC transporter ATP-binding protein [Clostridia bacterium]